ncbi:MAG: hypothetical protein GX443_07070 [Deltaproteobacteria bacterium]|nr:hypothetical protein [Deltaproteobacteria bacterium]
MSELEKGLRQPVHSLKEERPPCFGRANLVCPRDDAGLMQPQRECMPCVHLRACLQQALHGQGLISKSLSQEAFGSRLAHFIRRWSDQKLSHCAGSGKRSAD